MKDIHPFYPMATAKEEEEDDPLCEITLGISFVYSPVMANLLLIFVVDTQREPHQGLH